MQNTVLALADVVSLLLSIFSWVIIARALISWVDPNPYNPIVNFLYSVTEPLLSRARVIIPPIGGIDLSVIVVLVAILFLQRVLVGALYDLARGL